jgi:hypothetical protein
MSANVLTPEDIAAGKGDIGSNVIVDGVVGYIVGYGYEGEGNKPDPFLAFVRMPNGNVYDFDHPAPNKEVAA